MGLCNEKPYVCKGTWCPHKLCATGHANREPVVTNFFISKDVCVRKLAVWGPVGNLSWAFETLRAKDLAAWGPVAQPTYSPKDLCAKAPAVCGALCNLSYASQEVCARNLATCNPVRNLA